MDAGIERTRMYLQRLKNSGLNASTRMKQVLN